MAQTVLAFGDLWCAFYSFYLKACVGPRVLVHPELFAGALLAWLDEGDYIRFLTIPKPCPGMGEQDFLRRVAEVHQTDPTVGAHMATSTI